MFKRDSKYVQCFCRYHSKHNECGTHAQIPISKQSGQICLRVASNYNIMARGHNISLVKTSLNEHISIIILSILVST